MRTLKKGENFMNGTWTKKWKTLLIWFSGYFSFTTLAIIGGWTIVKSDDEDLKKTTKLAFIVTLIFAAISAFLSVYHNFAGLFDNYYSSVAYDIYDVLTKLVNLAKITVFAVFIIKEFVDEKKVEVKPEEEKKEIE